MGNVFLPLFVFVVGYAIFQNVRGQASESVKLTNNEDSCNVVHMHCSGGERGPSGPAGPMGPKGDMGPVGPVGNKGEKGSQGIKGERAKQINKMKLKMEMVGMIGAANCEELAQKHGINKSGNYLMKSTASPVVLTVEYCNFENHAGIPASTPFLKISGIRTCQELQERDGITDSGMYNLTTDDGAAFLTFCDFSTNEAVTEVRHDAMNEIEISPGCEQDGCYSKSPQYNLNDEQILSIIQNSRECRQFIKVRCTAMILRDGRAWWVSRDGEKMTSWGGARRAGYCACGETGSCINNGYKCNCDQNSYYITTQDEGYLTDKTKIPVKELRFADTGDGGEEGWHTLGKLECWGKA